VTNSLYSVTPYGEKFRTDWENLVQSSHNGIFQNQRLYLEYHQSKLIDESIVVLRHGEVVALLPMARVSKEVVCSHPGAAFGGLITKVNWHLDDLRIVTAEIFALLSRKGFCIFEYRPVPEIMHRRRFITDQEMLVSMGNLVQTRMIPYQVDVLQNDETHRTRNLKKANSSSLIFEISKNLEASYKVINDNLWNRHDTRPTHKLEEIQYLTSNFGESIRCYDVRSKEGGEILATSIIYDYGNLHHIQYLGSSPAGRAFFAVDFMIDKLRDLARKAGQSKLSYGHSLVSSTSPYLNYGLFRFKTSHGFSVTPTFHHQIDLARFKEF